MKNFVQPGNTVTLAASAGVKSGDLVIVGALAGVANYDAPAAGGDVEVSLVGVFTLPKSTGAAINQGAKTYWDVSESNCTATDTGNMLIGAAVATAGSSDTTVRVRLNGVSI
jgi:predicted RecA/RadA family phage recombinase